MPILYFIPPLAVLAYLTYRQNEYGLFVILATVPAFLLRTKVLFVPTTWLELAIYTVVLVWLIKQIKENTWKANFYYVLYQVKPYVIPLTILWLGVLISIVVSDNQMRALGILKAWFFAPLIFGVVFLDVVKTLEMLKKCIFSFSLSVWPIIIYGLLEYIVGINMTIPGRLDSFFSSPNYVVMYLVPTTVLLLGWMIIERGSSLFAYYSLWLTFALLTIFFTQSFGGWFALLGGGLFLGIFIPKVTWEKIVLLTIVGIIILGVSFFLRTRFLSHYDRFWQVDSWQMRTEIWTNSLKLLAQHPILGLGLADFKQEYRSYIDLLPPQDQPIEREVLRPHHLYLDFWLETGLIGLVAFLWLIFIFYQQNLSFYFKKHNILVIPAAGAMFAILVHGLADTPYFKNDLSLLFWFLILINLTLNFRLTVQETR